MNKFKIKRKVAFEYGLQAAAVLSLAIAGPAWAQSEDEDEEGIDEIVVVGTGTSLRGTPPVGQNLISVGELAIEESGAVSVQQILNDIPQITGFGNSAQGSYGSSDGAGSYAPTVHSLGASASNATLILVNGHRIPLTGTSHTLADPSIIPPAALQRVDILPDGASAVYGSDAVAGVLNFVTKKGVEETEISAQAGFADGYDTQNVNFLTGSSWAGGNVTLAYSYAKRSNLANKDRPNLKADQTSRGGGNYSDWDCGPATIDVGGTRYSAPYGANSIETSAPCDPRDFTDLVPEQTQHSLFLSYQKEFEGGLLLDTEFVYSDRTTFANEGAGQVSNYTVSDTNPFFVAPGGTGATSAAVYWDANELVGAAKAYGTSRLFYFAPKLEYDFGNSWVGAVSAMVGRDTATEFDTNRICGFCARDALSQSDPDLALDVWGGGNTSESVIRYITDADLEERAVQSMSDVKLQFDGEIFNMPGGPAKLAIGANSIRYNIEQLDRQGTVSGPASSNTQVISTDINRDVTAFFSEIYLPITNSFDLNLAVRADDYSDFGQTTNPRIAAQWQITDSFKIRATYAESFIAPALTSRGEEPSGKTTESGWGAAPGGGFGGSFVGPDFQSDNLAEFQAWCQANYPANVHDGGCDIGRGGVAGTWVTGGNYGLNEETGETFSVGFDLVNPDWAPGLRLSVTYYDKLLQQMVTAPRISAITTVPGLNNRLILMPTDAELAEWTAGLNQGSLVPTVNGLPAGVPTPYIWSFQQVNAFNIDAAGFDISADYSWDTGIGDWNVAWAINKKTRFDQQSGTGGEWQDFLNGDFNTTFSSLEYLHNFSVSWSNDATSAKLTWKHANEYDRRGNPSQTKIDAYNMYNLYLSYDLDSLDMQLFLQANNLTDEEPPFWDTNGGYNTSDSSPIGRVTTIGFRKTF